MIITNAPQMYVIQNQDVTILKFLAMITVLVRLIPVTKALAAYLPQFLVMIKMNAPQIPVAQFMDVNMITFIVMIAICVPLILVTLKLVVSART
jgi:hypothetical protein